METQIRAGYKDHEVGCHRLDLLVEKQVIVGLKVATAIVEVHNAQALSYMKATGMKVSLIINFGGKSLTWKRLVKTRT